MVPEARGLEQNSIVLSVLSPFDGVLGLCGKTCSTPLNSQCSPLLSTLGVSSASRFIAVDRDRPLVICQVTNCPARTDQSFLRESTKANSAV